MDASLMIGGTGPAHPQALIQGRALRIRQQIIMAAIRLYREIGHKKTTVLDIAKETSMSPANVYRFFGSKQEIEQVVVAELFEEIFLAANNAARSRGPAIRRLEAVLRVISELHERRLVHDSKLHELLVGAMHRNWSVAQSYAERIVAIVKPIVTAGQVDGEFRPGDATTLANCLLTFMQGHLNPILPRLPGARPKFDQMLDLCFGALRAATVRPYRNVHWSQQTPRLTRAGVTSAVES